MNFHNIEYFLVIAEERNISKAAKRLHISQQSLSEQLKKMENEVGARLVNRSRVLTLTTEGEMFRSAGEDLLHTYKKVLDEIASVSGKNKTIITLAIPSTEKPQFLPGLLSEFSVRYPEYEIRLVSCQPREAAKEAVNFDLYFSTLPLGNDLEHIPLMDCGSYAVAFTPDLAFHIYGEHWPEIEERMLNERNIAVLQEMPFILLLNHLGKLILDHQIIFQEAGFDPKIAFQSGNSDLNADLCELGTGVYLSTMDQVNHRFGGTGKDRGILIYPIDTSITPVWVAISHRKGMQLTKAMQCFVDMAKEYLKNYV